jgi:hypothetical protein
MDTTEKTCFAFVLAILGITAIFALYSNSKLSARIDALESASTVAQQPKECHYLLHNDTLFLDSSWVRFTGKVEFGRR